MGVAASLSADDRRCHGAMSVSGPAGARSAGLVFGRPSVRPADGIERGGAASNFGAISEVVFTG